MICVGDNEGGHEAPHLPNITNRRGSQQRGQLVAVLPRNDVLERGERWATHLAIFICWPARVKCSLGSSALVFAVIELTHAKNSSKRKNNGTFLLELRHRLTQPYNSSSSTILPLPQASETVVVTSSDTSATFLIEENYLLYSQLTKAPQQPPILRFFFSMSIFKSYPELLCFQP